MSTFPPALAHGDIETLFPNIYFVSGAMETVLQGMDWQFSRNMTIVKDADRLILLNSIRLNETGLAALDQLGKVTDVVRLGCLHGRDDAFYVDRYQANYWALSDTPDHEHGVKPSHFLDRESSLPISDASLFRFQTTTIPEAILRLERNGGILIACDALQNWHAPDEFFSEASTQVMTEMGFFTPANIGPVWHQAATPEPSDFTELKALSYQHALCGHGQPLLNTARQDFQATFKRLFNI